MDKTTFNLALVIKKTPMSIEAKVGALGLSHLGRKVYVTCSLTKMLRTNWSNIEKDVG